MRNLAVVCLLTLCLLAFASEPIGKRVAEQVSPDGDAEKHERLSCFSLEKLKTHSCEGGAVTRQQAQLAGEKLARAAGELDAYLASEAATRFNAEASDTIEELPPQVEVILERAGIGLDDVGELPNQIDEKSDFSRLSVLGYVIFKVCDGEYAQLEQLRDAWVARAFEVGFLTLSNAEKTQFSKAVVRQIRSKILPVAAAYADSWLAIAAVNAGCTRRAIDYTSFVLAPTAHEARDERQSKVAPKNNFGSGILAMTRSGLQLNTAKNDSVRINTALEARTIAIAQLLRGVGEYKVFLTQAGVTGANESMLDLERTFDDYNEEFVRVTSRRRPLIWRTDSRTPLLTNALRNRHGGGWWQYLAAYFMAPQWPRAINVLRARGMDKAAAAYALAALFDTKRKLSAFNGDEKSNCDVVWQAYGKAQTYAALEHAAATITLSAPELSYCRVCQGKQNGLASVKLFGHTFLLPSGESSSQDPATATRWFTLAEIKANFRASQAFSCLTQAANTGSALTKPQFLPARWLQTGTCAA
jgi:hypothetical protein